MNSKPGSSESYDSVQDPRDILFEVVRLTVSRLMEADDWETIIDDLIPRLAKAFAVDWIGLYQLEEEDNIGLTCKLLAYTHISDRDTEQCNINLWEAFFRFPHYASLRSQLLSDRVFFENFSNESAVVRELLQNSGVLSILAIPVYVNQECWGFLVSDECSVERDWTELEINALTIVANALSASIHRIRTEKIRSATLRISEAAHSAENLETLFASIHQIVNELMPAKNFYIALYDPVEDLISFPYDIDEYDEQFPPQKPGRGLTEYVLRSGKPLLATPKVFDELVSQVEKSRWISFVGVVDCPYRERLVRKRQIYKRCC